MQVNPNIHFFFFDINFNSRCDEDPALYDLERKAQHLLRKIQDYETYLQEAQGGKGPPVRN